MKEDTFDLVTSVALKNGLTSREYLVLMWLSLGSPKDRHDLFCGSESTRWRVIGDLRRKGYL